MAAAVAGEGPDIWAPEVGAPCQGVEAGDLLEVVGGASSGGIIVRAGREKTSAADARRLARGSRVRAREVEGERLRYELVEGEGPASGWVRPPPPRREAFGATAGLVGDIAASG